MDQQLEEPDLRSYLGLLARRKLWVIGVASVFIAIAVAMSVVPKPQYRVRATILTSSGIDLPTLVMGEGNAVQDPNREAANQASRIDGAGMRGQVAQALPPSIPEEWVWSVRVESIKQEDSDRTSNVVDLSLVSTDPDKAAQLLTIYASTYVEYWDNLNLERVIDAMTVLRSRIDELNTQLDEANARLANPELSETERATTNAEIDRLARQSGSWQDQLDRLDLSTRFSTESGNAEVISPAFVPETPISPDIPKNLAIGLIFGLFLGITVAFLRDYFDDSVKSKDIVERVTGVPALGLIPKFDTADSELVAAAAPSAPAAEAFRSLRTSVKFLTVDREVRVVQITSPSAGEGKTVTAVNLASVFAQAGDRVVLVGADLRRPRAEDILGVPLTPGLTGVLIGEVALPQAIRAVDGLPNLSMLPAGYPPPNPSELLSGERARRLIDVLAQTYDMVVLDCPPVLPVTDALVLARMADTTLLVTSVHRTSRRALDRCVEVLQQVGAPLVGTVMTSLAPGATFGGEPYRYDPVRSGRRSSYGGEASGGNGYSTTTMPTTYSHEATTGVMQLSTGTTPATGLPASPGSESPDDTWSPGRAGE